MNKTDWYVTRKAENHHLHTHPNSVVSGVLLPVLTLLSSTLLLIGVVSTLFVVNPVIASVSLVSFGGLYVLISFFVRRRLITNSQLVAQEQTKVVKALQEGLVGIRDVLLNGVQHIYSTVYRRADYPLRRAQANNVFVDDFLGASEFYNAFSGQIRVK